MKKQILLLISTIISVVSFAQVTPSIGVRAGLTSSSMRGDAVTSLNNLLNVSNGMITTSSRTGFFAGSYVNIPFAKGISLEPALYYSQKGYELKGALSTKGLDFLGANAKAQLQSQYLDIPVLLKANVGGLQLFAGPQFSYLLKADLHSTAGLLGVNLLNSTMDATSQFNRWDESITGGIGYQFSNGLNIMASYDYGLSKADANQNLKAYNNSFKIGIGVGL